jgi:hypothetical protein
MTTHDRADRLEQVEAQVGYHRRRLALARARPDAAQGRNSQRLYELERAYRGAQERLAALQATAKDD